MFTPTGELLKKCEQIFWMLNHRAEGVFCTEVKEFSMKA